MNWFEKKVSARLDGAFEGPEFRRLPVGDTADYQSALRSTTSRRYGRLPVGATVEDESVADVAVT